MRIVKEHDVRKSEIIDAAARLISQKGYEKCNINDILTAVGIAKGTFYYYFKSKEDVLNAVIKRTEDLLKSKALHTIENSTLSPDDKLLSVFLAMHVDYDDSADLITAMHKPENALLHQKSLVSRVEGITPILTDIVNEGVHLGIFHCKYPEEYMRIFYLSAITLLDGGIFDFSYQESQKRFQGLISLLEQMLGVQEGYLMKKAMKYSWLPEKTSTIMSHSSFE